MFKVLKKDDVGDTPILVLPTTASETYAEGEALVLTAGKLTKCGVDVVPTYISIKDYIAPTSNSVALPVIRVQKNIIFETRNSVSQTANIGDKVTLDATATKITATTTSGVAEIVAILGTNTNDKVHIRF